jgi:signal transduction histidine kinase/CheY-like chemotaxis protein
MKNRLFIISILTAFIAGTILLIYIQYNSAKNIDSLITGNEQFLGEYRVNAVLKQLERDVTGIESKIRNSLAGNTPLNMPAIDTEFAAVKTELQSLQKISDDDSTVQEIDELDSLVKAKLNFSREVIALFTQQGADAAHKLIVANFEKWQMDSIYRVTQSIENSRHAVISKLTASYDRSGQNALRFNNTLIALVLIFGAALFWYILNTVRKREYLIRQLNMSEKQVREAAEVKEKFMANMSHEIRTPMNAILGFTNLLQRKDLDQESKEYVQTIQKSGENLLTIINDVLDLSKIKAGMMRIESAPFSIRALMHSIEIMFTAKAVEKQLSITVMIEDSVPDTLEGDATRLTQVLVNLIGNALKFTARGTVTIHVVNEGITGNTIHTGIVVADTGIGIRKDKLQHIFDRFQQAEDSVTRNYGGTGLGLSIVQELVTLQNGSIAVESEPGIGTTFKLVFPYTIASEPAQAAAPFTHKTTALPPDFKDAFVLVVEDNEINQSLVKQLFKNWQLRYELANNGKEAVDKLRQTTYDLILMDIQMPEMDGYTATQEIRGKLKLDTPIIAMTAHALAGEREKCLSYGMDEYISKPIKEEKLHQLINQFVKADMPVPKKQEEASQSPGQYQYINLQYMKEVSGGNTGYEKAVTEQFIEIVPHDLKMLEKAWLDKHTGELRQLAHNMKTTVSIMGLHELLQPQLDALEYETLDDTLFHTHFSAIGKICAASVSEAKQFYATL